MSFQHTSAEHNILARDFTLYLVITLSEVRSSEFRDGGTIGNYARFPLAEALKTMDLQRLDELETIDPSPLPPWRADPFAEIEVGSDRKTAVERAENTRSTSNIVVYSDASGREGDLGAAVVALNSNLEIVESQQIQVGPMDRWLVHVAELIGIFYAISMVIKVAHQLSRSLERGRKKATILCDSRPALQTTQNPRNKSGQRIIHAILQLPQKSKQRVSRCAFNGCQGTVITPETTLRIDWPRMPRGQAKRTPSAHSFRGRARASAAISSISLNRNGGHPTKVVTYERSTTPCQQPTREGYMGACPGTKCTC
jgi:hypothetical protein